MSYFMKLGLVLLLILVAGFAFRFAGPNWENWHILYVWVMLCVIFFTPIRAHEIRKEAREQSWSDHRRAEINFAMSFFVSLMAVLTLGFGYFYLQFGHAFVPYDLPILVVVFSLFTLGFAGLITLRPQSTRRR